MPLESIMQTLCTMNYILNGEKADTAGYKYGFPGEYHQRDAMAKQEPSRILQTTSQYQDVHNTYSLEQTLMTIVRKGDTAALQEWVNPFLLLIQGGIAAEQLDK